MATSLLNPGLLRPKLKLDVGIWFRRKCYTVNRDVKSSEVATECFHVVLFIMLYKVVLTFKSVEKTLVCGHSNESY